MFEKEIKTLQDLIKTKSDERNKVLNPSNYPDSIPSIAEADYLQGFITGASFALAMLEKKALEYEQSGIEALIKIGMNSKYGKEAAEEAEKKGYVFQPGFLEDFKDSEED